MSEAPTTEQSYFIAKLRCDAADCRYNSRHRNRRDTAGYCDLKHVWIDSQGGCKYHESRGGEGG